MASVANFVLSLESARLNCPKAVVPRMSRAMLRSAKMSPAVIPVTARAGTKTFGDANLAGKVHIRNCWHARSDGTSFSGDCDSAALEPVSHDLVTLPKKLA